jgi:hypothetical protein
MRVNLASWAVTACVISLPGCYLDDLGPWRVTRDFHYSYPLKAGGKLSIETFNGSVDVTGWDQEMVEIDGAKYAPSPEAVDALRIEITDSPDSIEVRVSRPAEFRGNRGARFYIKMPRKAILDHVASSNGPVVVQGATGPTHLRTSNGSIHVGNFDDYLEARTSNASIDLADVDGEAVASTSNGRIRAENINGPLDASTTNSSIAATLAGVSSSRSIRLVTSNGPVDLTLPSGLSAGARVSTRNGRITIRMAPDISAHVLARTNNSSISSDFEMKVQGVISKNNIDAVIGNGGPLFDLSTSNAPIKLLRL